MAPLSKRNRRAVVRLCAATERPGSPFSGLRSLMRPQMTPLPRFHHAIRLPDLVNSAELWPDFESCLKASSEDEKEWRNFAPSSESSYPSDDLHNCNVHRNAQGGSWCLVERRPTGHRGRKRRWLDRNTCPQDTERISQEGWSRRTRYATIA